MNVNTVRVSNIKNKISIIIFNDYNEGFLRINRNRLKYINR